jgi:transcriptional regulator with XRE-family HTH domain
MPKCYQDKAQWDAVRKRVLNDGVSRAQVARETGISRPTISKMLKHRHPPSPAKGVKTRQKLGPFLKDIDEIVGFREGNISGINNDVQRIFE